MRYLETELFLLTTFYYLTDKNVSKVNLDVFNKIIDYTDTLLRDRNKTVLLVYSKELFHTIELYDELFCMTDICIMVQNNLQDVRLKLKNNIIGIPGDMRKTIKEAVDKILSSIPISS